MLLAGCESTSPHTDNVYTYALIIMLQLPHPLLMGGLSLADPMAPRTRILQVYTEHTPYSRTTLYHIKTSSLSVLQLEYQRAREAGRKSAQYVINRWPRMFPEVKPEPVSETALKPA